MKSNKAVITMWLVTTLLLATALDLRLAKGSNVGNPPHVVGDPNSLVRFKEGGEVKLKCPIQGDEPFNIDWYKEDDLIDFTWADYQVSGQNNKALKINKVRQSDAGVFKCKGVNGFGAMEFKIRLLPHGVQDPHAIQLFRLPESGMIAVDAGEDVELTCIAGNSDLTPVEIRWLRAKKVVYKDAESLSNYLQRRTRSNAHRNYESLQLDNGMSYELIKLNADPRIKALDSFAGQDQVSKLKLTNTIRSDSGSYACLLISPATSVDNLVSKSFSVTVREKVSDASDEELVTTASTSHTSSKISILKILLIILPIIAVILGIILIWILKSYKKSPDKRVKSTREPNKDSGDNKEFSFQADNLQLGRSVPVADPKREKGDGSSTLKKILKQPRVYQTPGKKIQTSTAMNDGFATTVCGPSKVKKMSPDSTGRPRMHVRPDYPQPFHGRSAPVGCEASHDPRVHLLRQPDDDCYVSIYDGSDRKVSSKPKMPPAPPPSSVSVQSSNAFYSQSEIV